VMNVPASTTSSGAQPDRSCGPAGAATARSAVSVAMKAPFRSERAQAGTLSRKPRTVCSRPSSAVAAASNPMTSRPAAGGPQAPGEPGLGVMSVHRAEQREHKPGELRLRGGDHRVDRVAPVRLGQRIDIARLARPQLIDHLAAALRVRLVPAGDVTLDD